MPLVCEAKLAVEPSGVSVEKVNAVVGVWDHVFRERGFSHWHDVPFTYDAKKTLRTARTFNGKIRNINQARFTIHMYDRWDIAQYVLKSSYFTSQQQVDKQTRGSPMGHPTSPVLWHMVCCVEDQTEFYGPPILLEEKDHTDYLGCSIDIQQGEVQLILLS